MKILQKNSCEISFFSILHENGLLTRQSEVMSAEHQDRSGHSRIQGFHLPLHGDLDRIRHAG